MGSDFRFRLRWCLLMALCSFLTDAAATGEDEFFLLPKCIFVLFKCDTLGWTATIMLCCMLRCRIQSLRWCYCCCFCCCWCWWWCWSMGMQTNFFWSHITHHLKIKYVHINWTDWLRAPQTRTLNNFLQEQILCTHFQLPLVFIAVHFVYVCVYLPNWIVVNAIVLFFY